MRVRLVFAVSILAIVAGLVPGRSGALVSIAGPLCGSTGGTEADPAPSTLRVATFNVLHGLEETHLAVATDIALGGC